MTKTQQMFSDYKKIVKVCAWVNRFVNNLKQTKNKKKRVTGATLTVEEIKAAEQILLENLKQIVQDHNFHQLKRQFNIQEHKLCELIVIHIHCQNKHCEVRQMLTELSQKYFINRCGNYVRKILSQCRRHKRKLYSYPDPPPLTILRLNEVRVFAVVRVDLYRPLFLRDIIRNEDSSKLFKSWVVLHTCAASRGVVLDLALNSSLIAFRRGLSRFVSRHGCSGDMISDNGSNFAAEETQ
ncbi:uncharacterized protein LOC130613616 [Hydractinia symbiolongicarpus]|uniref:uncharacterized protein LOC130613616 n=1 Tax=Hydractinia symbiolongicarpus TaxID=13093 RepID=UPI0025512949|nr:uncharacterized protein LOC130613616 [Hydractinia symbiolongicarpus]